VATLSSHYHLLLDVDDARQLSLFMAYVNSNLAREISRLHRWPGKIWSRRYQGIVISDEEGAQIARMRYLLANGCKEGLVARLQDWPGVHVAKALIQGEDLTGTWFDRTQEYSARNRGEKFDRLQYATSETLHLSPLPCWKHLPEEAWRGRALKLVQEIAEETTGHLPRTGSQPLGAAAILSKHPHHRPKTQKRSPPSAPPPAASSGKPIVSSSAPSGRPPTSCGREIVTQCFRLGASRRRCLSLAGKLFGVCRTLQMSC
jgi:hypothetical protein